MASAAAKTRSTTGSTTTPADPSIGPLKAKLATMEAELQQVQLTMENQRCAGSEFRQSILNSMSVMMTVPVTLAQPPLGPVPPPEDSDCFADQVRAQEECLTTLENQVACCNELIMEFKSQLEGLQCEEGVEEGPQRVTVPFMGHIILYILQISVAILKWLAMLLMYILTCMRHPIPMCM